MIEVGAPTGLIGGVGVTTGLYLLAQCTSPGRHLFHFLVAIIGTATGPVAGVTAELLMRSGVTEGSVQSLEQLQDV